VAVVKKPDAQEEVVFLAVRIPKSMKRKLQQAALNDESTVQALVRSAIQAELRRRARPSRSASKC
jgi:predicted transcriptional regulator